MAAEVGKIDDWRMLMLPVHWIYKNRQQLQARIFSESSCAGVRGERRSKVAPREKMMINEWEKPMRQLYSCGLAEITRMTCVYVCVWGNWKTVV